MHGRWRRFGVLVCCSVAACARPSPGPTPDPAGPRVPPSVELSTRPGEECEEGRHTLASATVVVGDERHVVPDPGFEIEACCEPFQALESPPGISVKLARCEPWSCGGGCLRTMQLLFVPHADPARAQWFELHCNENLSATPDGAVNDACDEVLASRERLELVLESTRAEPCPGEAGEQGRIQSATVTRERVRLLPGGIEREPGRPEPYRNEEWGCSE